MDIAWKRDNLKKGYWKSEHEKQSFFFTKNKKKNKKLRKWYVAFRTEAIYHERLITWRKMLSTTCYEIQSIHLSIEWMFKNRSKKFQYKIIEMRRAEHVFFFFFFNLFNSCYTIRSIYFWLYNFGFVGYLWIMFFSMSLSQIINKNRNQKGCPNCICFLILKKKMWKVRTEAGYYCLWIRAHDIICCRTECKKCLLNKLEVKKFAHWNSLYKTMCMLHK